MSLWSTAAALVFGGLLVLTAVVQPGSWQWRRRVRARDPFAFVPWWTFFAPNPGSTDTRLLWRERLVDGSIGPWRETAPPRGGALRAIWNPHKRVRKVLWDCDRRLPRTEGGEKDGLVVLGLPYLVILQHVLGLPASPLGAGRQFALVATQGADDHDGVFELRFASPWHRLPGAG